LITRLYVYSGAQTFYFAIEGKPRVVLTKEMHHTSAQLKNTRSTGGEATAAAFSCAGAFCESVYAAASSLQAGTQQFTQKAGI
jgi:hypothetical protein